MSYAVTTISVRVSLSMASPMYVWSTDSIPFCGYFSSTSERILPRNSWGMRGPSSTYMRTSSAAVRAGCPAESGRVNPQARIPPVEVPAITSKSSAMGRPVRRSISDSTVAGMMPRMPPPSMERIRVIVTSRSP